MGQEDMRHTHTMEYYSALKKEGNLTICDNMGESVENIMINEISQTERDKYCMVLLTCRI